MAGPVERLIVSDRIATLDLLRGIAVLGIVAVNVAGFAGAPAATETPALTHPAALSDEATFAFVLLLFEGKMRALFSMLFGASMLLFVEAAEARRRNGEVLQLRRLGWLLLIGWLHYVLLWWGDILFVYAVAGVIALALRRLSDRVLIAIATLLFIGWHGAGMLSSLSLIAAEEHVRAGLAHADEIESVRRGVAAMIAKAASDDAQAQLGFVAMIADKLATAPLWPVVMTAYTIFETLPLMLLGIVLKRSGFLAGEWPVARTRRLALGGIGLGGALTLALVTWAWRRHFPPLAMREILASWSAVPHVLMETGYAAATVLAAPRMLNSSLGRRLVIAGRVAFSNYLGTTLVMCALFYGWGFGLYGSIGPAAQLGLVMAWWVVMLSWGPPWLARYRQGPLEWGWRSLTEGKLMPLRITPSPPIADDCA